MTLSPARVTFFIPASPESQTVIGFTFLLSYLAWFPHSPITLQDSKQHRVEVGYLGAPPSLHHGGPFFIVGSKVKNAPKHPIIDPFSLWKPPILILHALSWLFMAQESWQSNTMKIFQHF